PDRQFSVGLGRRLQRKRGRGLRLPFAQAPRRHGRQYPDGTGFRLYAGNASSVNTHLRSAHAVPRPASSTMLDSHSSISDASATGRWRSSRGSLARCLLLRLLPPILVLVALDLLATCVISHKFVLAGWMLEDFF